MNLFDIEPNILFGHLFRFAHDIDRACIFYSEVIHFCSFHSIVSCTVYMAQPNNCITKVRPSLSRVHGPLKILYNVLIKLKYPGSF